MSQGRKGMHKQRSNRTPVSRSWKTPAISHPRPEAVGLGVAGCDSVICDSPGEEHRGATIIFASGKGGVGKTNVVANLAATLAAGGRKVLAVDGNLGLANLDILLGLTPSLTVGHFLEGTHPMESVAIAGPHGLRVIPSASGVEALTRLDAKQVRRLREALRRFGRAFDVTLIDGPGGISRLVTQLAGPTDLVVAVTSPESTALMDVYALFKVLAREEPRRRLGLIVNFVEDAREGQRVHDSLDRVVSKYLGRALSYWGHVVRDESLVSAVRKRGLVTELYPQSPASQCFEALSLRLVSELEPDFGVDSSPGIVAMAAVSRALAPGEMETIH